MNKFDILFDDNYSYDYKDAFSKLFACTDDKGRLCVRDLPHGDNANQPYLVCDMEYNGQSKAAAFEEFKQLKNNMTELLKLSDSEGIISPDKLSVAPESVKTFYNTYINPLDVGENNREEYDRLTEKWFDGEEYADEEEAFLEKCKEFQNKDACRRIGDNYLAVTVIVGAQRLFKLLAMKSPKIVCDNEEFLLLEAFVIHKFAKTMKLLIKSI